MIMGKEYFLMHKDIPVALLSIEESGEAKLIRRIPQNESHFPLGAKLNNSKFSEWWKNRYIPDNRPDLEKALTKNNYSSSGDALVKNLALSLNDCYWIKPIESNLKWENVSLFTNEFDDRIGESLFNLNKRVRIKKNKFDIGSTSGELKKKWIIDECGTRMLIKGNLGLSFQQSINEVFISDIHKQLKSKYYLPYHLEEIDSDARKIVCCVSPNFCNENVEFVSALEIIDSKKMKGSDNVFLLFKKGCLELGISENEFHNYMDYLILTDYLFTNVDRHLRNIGVLRNPDTLNVIGFSPIFDNGNSMFYDKSYDDLKTIDLHKIKTNSFYNLESKMLKFVKNFNILNLNGLKPDFSIYQKDTKENQIRYNLIEEKFFKKLEQIKKMQGTAK